MYKLFHKNKLIITGTAVGAVAGWLYWKLIGCAAGTCSITSKPINSTLYFSTLGALVFSLFKNKNKQNAGK